MMMTKGEREDLQRLVRQREKVLKSAEAEVEKANERIAAQCRRLGIPKDFAPGLEIGWSRRGANDVKERRAELRKVAATRIAAIEQAAVVKIEVASVEAQTEIAAHGLSSDAARTFLERLPSIEALMAPLDFAEIAGKADPPVVEQLVSPSALRQRRYRERHRNAAVTSRNGKDETSTDPDGSAAEPPPREPAPGARAMGVKPISSAEAKERRRRHRREGGTP